MRAFIAGISGFAGSHLAALLRAEGADVSGLSRSASGPGVHTGDVSDPDAVHCVLRDIRPDVVFHLAAEIGGADESRLHRINVEGTRNLLEAAATLPQKPRVLVAGSSAIYGAGPIAGAPISEDALLAPVGAYAASKAEQDRLAERLGGELGVPVIRTRAFNQTGPGERDRFVASSVARQIAEIEAGQRPPRIAIGRTDTLRDFSDVRDIALGYWLAATRGEPGEVYNLASGKAVSIREIVDRLLAMTEARIQVMQDPARLRPADIACQIGDASKAEAALGWAPAFPLERTLADLLDHWRAAVRPL